MTLAFSPTERHVVAALAGIHSLRMLGLFMILPVFAIYAKQLTSVTPLQIGLALGIYGLTQAIFQVPFGFLSDRVGRKPMIIIGLALFSAGSGVAALSTSISGVIIGRSLQGMGAIGGVVMALLADLTREEVRLRAMASIDVTIGLSFALAFIVGPLLGGWIGLQGIFWITMVLGLGAIGLVIQWVPTSLTNNEYSLPKIALLKSKGLIELYLGVMFLHASLTALFLKIPSIIALFEALKGETWRLYAPVLALSLVLTMPIILFLEKTKYFKIGLMVSVIGLGIAELGIWFLSDSLWGMGLSLCLFFVAFNVLEASLPSLISKQVASDKKGAALGAFSALQFLGLFLGGVIGGELDSRGGLVAVLLFCVILALIWFLLIFCSIDLKRFSYGARLK
jgi:MFS family permease